MKNRELFGAVLSSPATTTTMVVPRTLRGGAQGRRSATGMEKAARDAGWLLHSARRLRGRGGEEEEEEEEEGGKRRRRKRARDRRRHGGVGVVGGAERV